MTTTKQLTNEWKSDPRVLAAQETVQGHQRMETALHAQQSKVNGRSIEYDAITTAIELNRLALGKAQTKLWETNYETITNEMQTLGMDTGKGGQSPIEALAQKYLEELKR